MGCSQVIGRFGGTGVTHSAVADILRELHRGEVKDGLVEANHFKGNVIDVLEMAAKVNAVDQHIQIEWIGQRLGKSGGIEERICRIAGNRIQGIRISILRRMTLHADFHFSTDATVEGKGLMTPLAVRRLHHVPGHQAGATIRAEIECGVVDKRSSRGGRPPCLYPNAVGPGRIEALGQTSRKRIPIHAGSQRGKRAGAARWGVVLIVGLGHRDARDSTLLGAQDITEPMREPGLGFDVEVRQREAQGVKDTAVDGRPGIVGQGKRDRNARRAAWDHLHLRYPCG
jgi:hypothetical protein